jgi:hypothetical protein
MDKVAVTKIAAPLCQSDLVGQPSKATRTFMFTIIPSAVDEVKLGEACSACGS